MRGFVIPALLRADKSKDSFMELDLFGKRVLTGII